MSTITEELVTEVVANNFGVGQDKVKILGFEKYSGSAHGDGFASTIFKLDVKAVVDGIERSDLSYIAKTMPENDMRSEMLAQVSQMFAVCSKFYCPTFTFSLNCTITRYGSIERFKIPWTK